MRFFLTFLIPYLFITILVFSIGVLYLSFFVPKMFDKIKSNFLLISSISTSLGFVFLTSCIAVFYTSFNTVFLFPFVLLMVPLFNLSHIKKNISIRSFRFFTTKEIVILLGSLSFVFLYNFLTIYRLDGYLFYDLIYTGKISKGILEFGNESFDSAYGVFQTVRSQNLYHYGDLWINSFFSNVFNLSHVEFLGYVMYPFLHFIVLLLVLSLFYSTKKKSFWFLLMGFSLLYGSELFITYDFNNPILNSMLSYSRGFTYHGYCNKHYPIYLLVILSNLLYRLNFYSYSIIILSFVPLFYSTTIPAIAGISVFVFIVSIINRNYKIPKWNFSVGDSFFLLASIFFILFLPLVTSFNNVRSLPIQFYSFKTYIVVFIETFIKLFIQSFIVLFLLVFSILKSRGKIFFNPWILISFVGLLSGFIFVYIHSKNILDIDQALTNIGIVLILILGIESITSIRWRVRKFIIVFMLFCGISNLLYVHFNQDEWGVTKASITLGEKFSNKVKKYSLKYPGRIISCSIREKEYVQPKVWTFQNHNKFQDLFISDKIDLPLEICFLFNKVKNLDTKDHPYFLMFKDKKITMKRILFFLKAKNVNHLFIDNHQSVNKVFLNNFKMLYFDEKTNGSFWVSRNIN